jgi:hypothetical protein
MKAPSPAPRRADASTGVLISVVVGVEDEGDSVSRVTESGDSCVVLDAVGATMPIVPDSTKKEKFPTMG